MEPDPLLPVIPRWIEFSQFQVNPYFAWLFSGRITCTVSGYEISLLPAAFFSNQMIVPSAFSGQIIDLIKSQFLTYPPCKRLAIKYWGLKERECIPKRAVPIRIVENKSGIKVLEILATMQACVDKVTKIWLDQTRQLRDAVSRVDYRQDIWHVSGAPKLIIGFDFPFNHPGLWADPLMAQAYYNMLDNHQASHNTYSSLENRLAEWVPIELWPGYKSL
ncbi:hypothetical protein BS50DRAFT_593545 [Corynespora cassiicola Philippines]|uniref:Uncharacterized protein n=1 Tax=Corynespora cassiicola Philippines TaxID=1448308 RepID=A0A2T2N5Z6_CORCC|nr:hypothetical protein BS50DRAFT_593545 [Corynespora cassiicola Philippines]